MSASGPGAGRSGRLAKEQRSSPRSRVEGIRCAVQVGPGWFWVTARIVDFSTKGIRLHTPLAWEAGNVRRIRLVTASTRLEIAAACIWSRQEGKWRRVVGAAFQGVTPAQDALLAELLARHGLDPILSEAA